MKLSDQVLKQYGTMVYVYTLPVSNVMHTTYNIMIDTRVPTINLFIHTRF